MLVGYMRVSSADERQSVDLQRDALLAAGVDERHFHLDKASGARDDRPGLQACLAYLEAGDVLVVWKLDRLGRSLPHLLAIVADLKARGVAFRSLTERMDTTTPQGELLFSIFGALAQYERALTRERVMAGLAAARRRGARVAGRRRWTRRRSSRSPPRSRRVRARPASAAASRWRARPCSTPWPGSAGPGPRIPPAGKRSARAQCRSLPWREADQPGQLVHTWCQDHTGAWPTTSSSVVVGRCPVGRGPAWRMRRAPAERARYQGIAQARGRDGRRQGRGAAQHVARRPPGTRRLGSAPGSRGLATSTGPAWRALIGRGSGFWGRGCGGLAAQPDLPGEVGAPGGVGRRHHGVVLGQTHAAGTAGGSCGGWWPGGA